MIHCVHCLYLGHLEMTWNPLLRYLASREKKIYQFGQPCNSYTHNINLLYRPDCYFLHDVDHIPGSKRVRDKFSVNLNSDGVFFTLISNEGGGG